MCWRAFALCGNRRCIWRPKEKDGALRVCAWPVRGPVWGAALRARVRLSRRAAAGGCRVLARLCPVRQSPMYLVP